MTKFLNYLKHVFLYDSLFLTYQSLFRIVHNKGNHKMSAEHYLLNVLAQKEVLVL